MKISRNQEVLKVDCDKIRNAPVIKANSLVEAHYSLNLIHQKIILIIASQVKVDDTSFNEIEMPVADLLNLLNLKGKNYTYIKKVTRELNRCVIELVLDDGNTLRQAPWMSFAEYKSKEGVVRFKLNDAIKPFILQLNGHFTKYKLASVIQFSSQYSIRIYELLMQYMKIGSRKFTLESLRKILMIQDSQYTKWNDFRRYVIEQALKELTEKSDITFEYEALKDGKRVVAVNFKILRNEQRTKKISEEIGVDTEDLAAIDDTRKHPYNNLSEQFKNDELTGFLLENLSKNSSSDLQSILRQEFMIQENESSNLIAKYGKEKLWEKYHYYHYKKSTTEIKNPTAWFINAVIKNYSTADMRQSKAIPDIDWSGFDLEQARLTDLKNELNLLNDILKEAQANLASPVCEYSSALREQYQTQIKDTNAKIAAIQKEIKELESHVN